MLFLKAGTVPLKKGPANYVPAAAVIRRVQALSGITGCKVRRRACASEVKSHSLTVELPLIRQVLSVREGGRILGVAVKCVHIKRNTGGEGGHLAHY